MVYIMTCIYIHIYIYICTCICRESKTPNCTHRTQCADFDADIKSECDDVKSEDDTGSKTEFMDEDIKSEDNESVETEFKDEDVKLECKEEDVVKEELKSEDEACDTVKVAKESTEVKVENEDDGEGSGAARIEQENQVESGLKDEEHLPTKVKVEPGTKVKVKPGSVEKVARKGGSHNKQKGKSGCKRQVGDASCRKGVKEEPGTAVKTKVKKEPKLCKVKLEIKSDGTQRLVPVKRELPDCPSSFAVRLPLWIQMCKDFQAKSPLLDQHLFIYCVC